MGETLHNCVADDVAVARAGQSIIVGEFDGARLVAALELGPDLAVRQYRGLRNAQPPADQQASLNRVLTDAGLPGLNPRTAQPFG